MQHKLFLFICLLVFSLRLTAQDHAYRERIYVNLDQDTYLAGEWCWLSAYSLDAATNQLRDFSKIAYLEVIDDHGNAVVQSKLALSGGQGTGAIQLPADLPGGTYTLRAYTRWMRNFSSEAFFTRELNVFNTLHPETGGSVRIIPSQLSGAPDPALHCKVDKVLCDRRSPMTVQLNAGMKPSGLSLAVYRIDTTVEKAKVLPIEPKTYPLVDTLLPELKGNIITGRIVNRTTGKPEGGIIGTLSIPSKKPLFYAVNSDENGRFITELEEAYGNGTLILECQDQRYQVVPDNGFAPVRTPAQEAQRDTLPESAVMAYSTRHQSAQVEHAFRERELGPQAYVATDSSLFFGHPDEEVLLDDYTRFTTMEEVFREVVKQVMVRRAGGALHVHVWNLGVEVMDRDDALVLLDGVPVYDSKKLFDFDPLKVRKVSVMARPYFYGALRAQGIVALQTYSGDLKGFQLDSWTTAMDFIGLQSPHPFEAPVYATETARQSRFPDYRSLLYWAPSVHFDDKGEAVAHFYTSDIPGHYLVVAAGLDANGKPCYTSQAFDVK